MDKKSETLIFRDCVYADQTLFFFAENINKPVKHELQKGSSVILPYDDSGLYMDLETYCGGAVYALEMSGKNLLKYDLNNSNAKLTYIGCDKHQDGNFA